MVCRIFTHVNFKLFMSEFLSTGFLVFFSCWGAAVAEDDILALALHRGFITIMLFHIFGCISGAHHKPGASMIAYFHCYLDGRRTLVYITAQLSGAFSGYWLLGKALPDIMKAVEGKCLSEPKEMNAMQALALEFLFSTVLNLAYLAMWDIRNAIFQDSHSLQMGALMSALTLAGHAFTNASFNSAKTLAISIYERNFEHLPYFIVSNIFALAVAPPIWTYGTKNIFCKRAACPDNCPPASCAAEPRPPSSPPPRLRRPRKCSPKPYPYTARPSYSDITTSDDSDNSFQVRLRRRKY